MRPDKKKKAYRGKGAHQQRQQESCGSSSCNTVDEAQVSTPQKSVASSEQPGESSTSSKVPIQPADVTSTTELETTSALTDVNEGATKQVKKFSKRQVFSNWERYAEPVTVDGEDLDAVTDGVDFERLLQTPSSGDGHFMFKSEKLTEPPNIGNLFALDLKLLSTTLRSIPFYKQLDLHPSIFSESELAAMDKEAENRALHAKSYNPKSLIDFVSKLVKDNTAEEPWSQLPQTVEPNTEASSKTCLPKVTDILMPENNLITNSELEGSKSSQSETNTVSIPSVTAKEQTYDNCEQQSANQKTSIVCSIDADLEPLNTVLDNKLAISESKIQPSECDIRPDVSSASGEDLEAWLDSVLDD